MADLSSNYEHPNREFDEIRVKKIDGYFGVTLPVMTHVPYTDAQTAAYYTTPFFIAQRAYQIIEVTERHETAGTDASAVTVMLKKVPSGTAPGSGTDILSAGMSLKSTANTNQSGTLSQVAGVARITSGESLTLVTTGTLTAVVGVTVSVLLKAI